MNDLSTVSKPDYTPEQLALIKKTIAKDATSDELSLFLYIAKKKGLDPLDKQIYFQKRGGKPVFITAIDGFRLIASRTGEHAGTDDVRFTYNDRNEVLSGTATVYRIVKGYRAPFQATAHWDEYCPPRGQDSMWIKMPHTMLGKCAEALALRRAFPSELSGLYANEEMDQAQEKKPQRLTLSDETRSVGSVYPSQPEPGDGVQSEMGYRVPKGSQYNKRSLEELHRDGKLEPYLKKVKNLVKDQPSLTQEWMPEFIEKADAFIKTSIPTTPAVKALIESTPDFDSFQGGLQNFQKPS